MSTSSEYLPRIIDAEINDRLEYTGGILIEGPKWCGKTRSSLEVANSTVRADENVELAMMKPSVLLENQTPPLLVDEWQVAPPLWDAARRIIDDNNAPGQFIFTGSSIPLNGKPVHSGAGRFATIQMRTMSLYESNESDGKISLRDLFDNQAANECRSSLDFKDGLLWAIVRGGWPASLSRKKQHTARMASDYLKRIENMDFKEETTQQRDNEKIKLFIKALARSIATPVKINTLVNDINERAGEISRNTASSYLNLLKEFFIIEEQPAWKPSLRTKAILRKAPKRHFTDPSIAAAALNATPEKLLADFKTLGFFFESLCYRDLSVYSQALQGRVYHYQDNNDFEIDSVIELDDGRWGAIEVKLSRKEEDEAAANLLEITSKINTDHIGNPSFLAILTSEEYGYVRDDGVQVIPIGCLGP